MVVVVFRFRIDTEANLEELGALIEKMKAFVSEAPGFLSVKDFAAEDGEVAAIAEFDSLESVDAWRDHPEHVAAQKRGREEFFEEYRLQVCNLIRTGELAPKRTD